MTRCGIFPTSTQKSMSLIAKHFVYICLILNIFLNCGVSVVEAETQCWKRKYYVNIFGRALNATVSCPKFYQWTVSDYCCYEAFDRFDSRPFCCYSETYKLFIAVGLICLVLLGLSICLILCWIYSIPHYILYALTCGKFSLLKYMSQKGMVNGPYVDPSFYSGEPFWSPGNADIQPYPLRPMPPKIFYPAVPRNLKTRWSKEAFPNGQMPLFILASRQFTRNPYSARPNERQAAAAISASAASGGPMSASSSFSGPGGDLNSRRSSTTSTIVSDSHRERILPNANINFRLNIDEGEAAAELLEAVKNMEDKSDKDFVIPRLTEETQMDLDLENEKLDQFMDRRRNSSFGRRSMASEDRPLTSISGAISRRNSNASPSPMGSISFASSQSILEEISVNTLLNHADRRQSRTGEGPKNPNIPGFIPEERI